MLTGAGDGAGVGGLCVNGNVIYIGCIANQAANVVEVVVILSEGAVYDLNTEDRSWEW